MKPADDRALEAKIRAAAKWRPYSLDRLRAPNLPTLAGFIKRRLGFAVYVERSTYSTDRKIPGTRLRHEGKGRQGYYLEVWIPRAGAPACRRPDFTHHSGETYRHNGEVCAQIVQWLDTGRKVK